MKAGTIEIDFVTNMSRLVEDMRGAKNAVETNMKGIESAVGRAKAALGALGVGISAGVFAAMIKGTIDALDRLNDLSKVTRIAVEDLAGLNFAAKQSGSDLNSIADAIQKLAVNMGKDGVAGKFKEIGVTSKIPIEALKQLADFTNKLGDQNTRSAVAMGALGKSYAGTMPLLAEGSVKIQEMIDKGKRLSGITKEMAEQADAFNDSMVELQTVSQRAMVRMVGPMLSGFTDILKAITLAYEESGKLKAVWVALGALGQFLFTDDFLSKAVKTQREIALVSSELEMLQKRRKEVAESIGPMTAFLPELDMKIREKLVEIKHLQNSIPKPPKEATPEDEAARRKREADERDAAARAARFLALNKEMDDKYKALMKTISESTAVLGAEVDGFEKLSDAEKFALKTMVDLKDGHLVLSAEQKKGLVVALEGLLTLDAEIKRRKELAEVYKAAIEHAKHLADEEERRNAIVADANTTYSQQIKDLEFETEMLKLEGTLAAAGLLTKEEEIKLIAKVNLERDTAIELRKIELDLEKKMLALGPEVNEGYEEAAKKLRELADAQKAALPDVLAARSNAKLVAELNRETVGIFNTMWSTVESTGKNVFSYLLGQGTSTMESIGKAIKASIIDVLYQMTVRKWIIQVGTSVAGSLGIGGATDVAGASNPLGGAGSALSMASGANSLYNLATGSGPIGAAVGAYQGVTGAVAAEGAMYAVGGTVAEGALAGISAGLAAVPVWGWAALAAMAVLSMDDGESKLKKQEAYWRPGQSSSPYDTGHFSVDNLTSQNPEFYKKVNALSEQLGREYSKEELTRLNGIGAEITGGSSEEELWTKLLAEVGKALSGLKTNSQEAAEAAQTLAVETAVLAEEQEKAAALGSQRRGMEIQLMEAQGRSLDALQARRQDELAALDASLRPLQEQIYAAQDLAGASAKAAEQQAAAAQMLAQVGAETLALAQERRALQIRLLEAQGRADAVLAARREDETAATNELNRELLRQIYAAEDAAKASAAAAEAQRAQTEAQEAANAAQRQAREELARTAEAFRGFALSLQSAIDQLRGGDLSTLSPEAKLAESRSNLNSAATRAMAGELDALSKLPQIATAFLESSRAYNASGAEYVLDFNTVMALLERARNTAAERGTIPGFASGLDTVPYDNFAARLHKDEAVLNRSAAAAWRSRTSNDGLQAEVVALRRDIARMGMQLQQAGIDQVSALKGVGAELKEELSGTRRDLRAQGAT